MAYINTVAILAAESIGRELDVEDFIESEQSRVSVDINLAAISIIAGLEEVHVGL